VAATFESGRPQSGDYAFIGRKGRRIPVVVHTVPIRSSLGEPELVMELALDVSEMTRVREELQTAQERLASLGLMVGSVSHGVKGILTGMDAGVYLSESALRRGDLDRAREGIATVKEMVARIRRVVLDVLYFAKERPLGWSRVDVGDFVEKLTGPVAERVRNTGVELAVDVGADPGRFETDESALSGALLNLLDNAVDACRQERTREAHRVTLRVRPLPDRVCFEVEDDGVGMTADARRKAFDLFYSSKGASGTGFGLFIARQVIRQHGGRIDFESTEGVGTLFRVELPRVLPESAKPPAV
jgi:signal transduction histidine kinase